MKVVLDKCKCTVIKEAGDPHFVAIKNATGESGLLYHLKQILNANGFNIIKKRMCKDGHLVSDMQQYLRARNPNINGLQCIWNTMWAIQGADEILNESGEVNLQIEWGEETPADVIDNFHHIFQKDYTKHKV